MPAATQSALAAPVIENAGADANDVFAFSFTGSAGQSYSILSTTNLTLSLVNWTLLHTGTFGFDPVTFAYARPVAETGRFFRVCIP
jgi:hypothetical protein